ncbi:MAG: tRNA (adenosine(37)-N6)-threonylcarbamoyltransferase complex ATPase subunit type 1 TsaE [Acetatifactor sp.]|nr:tRNA (adenosine(37)-N6)-threonylcarbamoyltransferase complex ATPase subunit type 1 TsaE [Acetatifactor sp.]
MLSERENDMRDPLRLLEQSGSVEIESEKCEDTYMLGKLLGENCRAGEVYTLIGDLGVGKTVFTQGFAAGLGVSGPVNSPTFTIVSEYDDGRLPFYHFDVYRIGDSEEMDEIGYEDYIYGEGVSLIEWANLIEDILPEQYTRVTIEKDLNRGLDFRRITLERVG